MNKTDEIKKYLMTELNYPYEESDLTVTVDMDFNELHIETDSWVVNMGLGVWSNDISLYTKGEKCIMEDDFEFIMSINSSRETLTEIWFGYVFYDEDRKCFVEREEGIEVVE